MSGPVQKELQAKSIGVYPPAFCDWRLLIAVIVITEISVLLVGMGRGDLPGWRWIGLATIYGQWMALFCASGLCVMNGWVSRLSPRGAWIGSWLTVLLLAAIFSQAAWLIADYRGLWPEKASASLFVWKNTFSVGLVTFAFFRYLLIRIRWRSELLAQAEAQVQALQARIRPHFLFNSLNTIASLVPEEPEAAEAAIEDLADIFRGSMRRADQPISLADELCLARQYLDMEKRRLGQRLDIDWRVDELPPGASVLPLMLQPLLENAVTHGIQSRPEGGTIVVYGRAEGDKVVVTIGNPVAVSGSSASGHGMAIDNVRERLRLAYGSRAGLLTHEDSGQFYAVLSMPYVEYSDHR
jgi:two-component system sensor histidine kinase AlgZ